MKKIAYKILLLLAIFCYSCEEVLDIEDISNYNPDLVWDDENLANAYMANIYPMFGNWNSSADKTSQQLASIPFYDGRVTLTNGNNKIWNYSRIRLINQALVDVELGNLAQKVKNNIKGQALFMRAYTYFFMVVNHGGIPYIKIPQDKDVDDLLVKRNSTADCFQFILDDLNEAISLLPEKIESNSPEFGKIDGSFALAFKAKVALYKASPQFHSTKPWDNADWQTAYTENKNAYETLLSRGYDLMGSYADVFDIEKNKEVIFAVVNSTPNKHASWDHGVRPGSESRGAAHACPTWEFVKEFPMKDGKLFSDPSSMYHKSEDSLLQSFWLDRDPRYNICIASNGQVWELSGKTDRRQYNALGIAHSLDCFGVNPNAGTSCENLDRYSGFFIRKLVKEELTEETVGTYDVDFIRMRFAEVLLNYAETANETGQLNDAIDLIIRLRSRAGIAPGADNKYGITATTKEQMREVILNERNIELCFEGHRFNDLRRLRMFDRLDGKTKFGVEAIAINSDGSEMSIKVADSLANKYELTETNFKYSLLQIPFTGVKESTVPDTYYFMPIKQSSIDNNENLEQNIDWGGSFVPTLD